MIIEIESVYGDKLLHGKKMTENVLNDIVKQLILLVGERDFISAFCSRYGYEEIPYSHEISVDYTVDLDTHLIRRPKY